VVRYVVRNVQGAADAELAGLVPGEQLRSVGQDYDSYRGLLAEIERPAREGPLVLVGSLEGGRYPMKPEALQSVLVGLAQVVPVVPQFIPDEMSEVLGSARSVVRGGVSILFAPSATGVVLARSFSAADVAQWRPLEDQRISRVLAWVTTRTNLPRLHRHIRPDGVVQLAMRRRILATRNESAQMDVAQLRGALEEATKQLQANYEEYAKLVDKNGELDGEVAGARNEAEEAKDEARKKDFVIEGLKTQLARAGGTSAAPIDLAGLLALVRDDAPPTPAQCLALIENVYRGQCVVLDSARESAVGMDQFIYGRTLLDLLQRLVTSYRDALVAGGGDAQARAVFGKNEYAARESDTTRGNKVARRERQFLYRGEEVDMQRHLKIRVSDDVSRTIRVHFHWDAKRGLIVIGHCGEHLSLL
jgi:hypothetical protein